MKRFFTIAFARRVVAGIVRRLGLPTIASLRNKKAIQKSITFSKKKMKSPAWKPNKPTCTLSKKRNNSHVTIVSVERTMPQPTEHQTQHIIWPPGYAGYNDPYFLSKNQNIQRMRDDQLYGIQIYTNSATGSNKIPMIYHYFVLPTSTQTVEKIAADKLMEIWNQAIAYVVAENTSQKIIMHGKWQQKKRYGTSFDLIFQSISVIACKKILTHLNDWIDKETRQIH